MRVLACDGASVIDPSGEFVVELSKGGARGEFQNDEGCLMEL